MSTVPQHLPTVDEVDPLVQRNLAALQNLMDDMVGTAGQAVLQIDSAKRHGWTARDDEYDEQILHKISELLCSGFAELVDTILPLLKQNGRPENDACSTKLGHSIDQVSAVLKKWKKEGDE